MDSFRCVICLRWFDSEMVAPMCCRHYCATKEEWEADPESWMRSRQYVMERKAKEAEDG